MSENNFEVNGSRDLRRALAWILFLLGVGFWIWGVIIFLTEPLIWARAMQTMAVGLLVWCLAMGAARDYPAASVLTARIFVRIGVALKADLGSAERRFAALGLVTGATVGCLFAIHYLYLFKLLYVQIGLVLAAATLGWFSHLILHRAVHFVVGRFFTSPWRRAAGVWGVYAAVWACLLAGPFDGWEALGTEPILKQIALGLGVGVGLCWLMLGKWRGPEGKVHRPALVLAAILIVAASAVNAARELSRTESPRQRVLLLTLDTTRADYLSCYGYPRETSPHLDELARSGARFEGAYSQAGITDPSHASILTGTYPRTHGLEYQMKGVTGDVPSMAEFFADRGYVTAAVISRDHVLPSELNVPGFIEMIGVRRWIGKTGGPEAYRRAANYLYRYRDKNLFLWVHFFDPHDSYEPHPGYSDKFYDKDRGRRRGNRRETSYSDQEVKYMRDLYAGEIYYMDYWIGKLLEMVRNLEPVPQNPPMVAVVADHGEFLGEYMDHPMRFGFGHGPIYNLGVHVPLIFSWPGHIPERVVVHDIVQSIDLSHTLVDYVLEMDYPGQGHSLRGAINGEPFTHTAVIYNCREHDKPVWHYDPLYAVIKDEMKYMITDHRDGELFDLSTDWEESRNLSGVMPEMVKDMTVEWEDWMKKTPKAKPDDRELSPSEIKALKALGYIE